MKLNRNSVLLICLVFFLLIYTPFLSSSSYCMKNELRMKYTPENLSANINNNEDAYSQDFVSEPTKSALSPSIGGPQKFAVICVRYSDVAVTRWTKTEIEGIMDTINDFWYNASYHTVTISYQVEGWYVLPDTENGYSPLYDGDPLTTDHWDDVIDDAIELADDDINFANFDFVLVWINDWWRGISTIGSGYQIITDDGTFNVAASLVGENSPDSESQVWGRVAHEMGHSFGLGHTHDNYNSSYSLMARAYPADLTIYSQVQSATGWFDTTDHQERFYPGDPENSFVLRPRSNDIPGDLQSLQVVVTYFSWWGFIKIPTKYYLVEVVNQSSEDAWVLDEGVLIYLVDPGSGGEPCTDMDAKSGTATLQDCLYDVGETFTDSANSITIEIVKKMGIDGYEIRVNNDAGPTDLMIRPWGSEGSISNWESPDIWVDSPINGWDFYRYRDSSGNPIGIGDDPWMEHENKLWATIHNVGGTSVSGAIVKFYERVPIGIGTHSWQLIDQVSVDITALTSKSVSVPWVPGLDACTCQTGIVALHGCVKVVIEPVSGEGNTGNNEAQENINHFEITPGTSGLGTQWGSFCMCLMIVNPLPFYFYFMGDSQWSWRNQSDDFGRFYDMGAEDGKNIILELDISPETPFETLIEAEVVMSIVTSPTASEGFIGDIHLEPIGGISIRATTLYRSSISLTAKAADNNTVEVKGTLFSLDNLPSASFPKAGGDRYIFLELSKGATTYDSQVVEMDDYGVFNHTFTNVTSIDDFIVTAYYAGSDALSSTSKSVSVGVIGPEFFELIIWISIIGGVAIVMVTLYIIRRKRKRIL